MEENGFISFDSIYQCFKQVTGFKEYLEKKLNEAQGSILYNDDTEISNEEISNVMSTAKINAYKSLYSHRKYIGKLIVFIKKIIRKLLKWYIEPICNDMTNFNMNCVNLILKMDKRQKDIEKNINNLKNIVTSNLEQQINLSEELKVCIKDTITNYYEIEFLYEQLSENFDNLIDKKIPDYKKLVTSLFESDQQIMLELKDLSNNINKNQQEFSNRFNGKILELKVLEEEHLYIQKQNSFLEEKVKELEEIIDKKGVLYEHSV